MGLFDVAMVEEAPSSELAMKKRTFAQVASQAVARGLSGRLWLPEPEQTQRHKHVTLLFGDVVGSTELLAAMGDLEWMRLVSEYYSVIRREYKLFGGFYLATAGDGFLAAFVAAKDAVDCAYAILRSVKPLGLQVRIGVHTGECLDMGGQLVGLTVHVGARIAATAGANEVLVSDSVKNEISDSGMLFLDRGTHCLKGVPGEWQLFGLDDARPVEP